MTWAGESAQSGVYIFTEDGSPEVIFGNISEILIFSDTKPVFTGEVLVTPSGNLENSRLCVFRSEFDNGDSGTSITINWNEGQKQKVTLTGAVTFTFVDPPSTCNLLLKAVQDNTGGRATTWPSNVKFPGGLGDLVAATGDQTDIVSFYFDGADYHSVASLDFF